MNTSTNKYTTNVYQWLGPKNWESAVGAAFKQKGYSWDERRAWLPDDIRTVDDTMRIAVGWRILRMPLKRHEYGLIFQPARFAFDGDSKNPMSKPNLTGLPIFDITPHLSGVDTLVASLGLLNSINGLLKEISPILLETCSSEVMRHDASRSSPILSRSLARVVSSWQQGKICLLTTGEDPTPNRDFIISNGKKLKGLLDPQGHNVELKFTLPESSDIQQKASEAMEMGYTPIAFICLPGSHGDMLSTEIRDLLQTLSMGKIPFQIMSYQNTNAFSLRNLSVAVSQKVGCIPFIASGGKILDQDDLMLLGVDQAHPRGKDFSYLSIVALSTKGELLARFYKKAPRDETLNAEALIEGLKFIKDALGSTISKNPSWLVMRDGRRFENETWVTWDKLCGREALTFLEVIKNPIPRIYSLGVSPPPPGALFSMLASGELFLYPVRARGASLGHLLRLRIIKNPKSYSDTDIGELVTACCHMAGLGLHPSTRPAPIYWADGFAGLKEKNLRFSGFSGLASNLKAPGTGPPASLED